MDSRQPNLVSAGQILTGLFIGALIPIGIASVFAFPFVPQTLAVGFAIAAPVILIVGLPICLLLRNRGRLNVYSVAWVGGLICVLPFLGYLIWAGLTATPGYNFYLTEQFFGAIVFFVPLGAVCAAIGWFAVFGFRANPN